MPETSKEKKIRLYKFASEYNLSTDSLIEFLQKKGYEVKGHMSILSEEMLNDIKSFFKKDIEKAEKHYKKISEFQKKRTDRTDSEAETEVPVETETPVVVEQPVAEEKEEEIQQVAETIIEEQPEPVNEIVEKN
jgi:translation initiation factor IF-2